MNSTIEILLHASVELAKQRKLIRAQSDYINVLREMVNKPQLKRPRAHIELPNLLRPQI